MTLKIHDFGGTHEADSASELETVLQKTYASGVNGFWLSHDDEKDPAISLLVNCDLACIHYFPGNSHPGFVSVGTVPQLSRKGTTTFYLDTLDQEEEMPNESVVRFSEAVQIAKDFLSSKELPKSIDWSEL